MISRYSFPTLGEACFGALLSWAFFSCSSYGGQGVRPDDDESEQGEEGNGGVATGGTSNAGGGTTSSTSGGSSSMGSGGSAPWMPPPDGRGDVPSDLIDLSIWRLELPVAQGASITLVEWPALDGFEEPPYFQVSAAGTSVLFHTPIEGATTPNSSYPRTELREMNGPRKAYWGVDSGTHTMEITQRINRVPPEKPHVVAGQIHDDDDDVIMIRFEQDHDDGLFIESRGDTLAVLDADYSLGEWFGVKIVAASNQVSVSFKKGEGEYGEPRSFPIDCLSESLVSGAYCYFKAGSYAQSNIEQGDSPGAVGEVEVSRLVVTHEE